MSCYLRHMKDILDEAGIEVTGENRKQIDQAIHMTVDVAYKNCSVTWKKIKSDIKKTKVFWEIKENKYLMRTIHK